jgi:CRISPR-associated protein Cas6
MHVDLLFPVSGETLPTDHAYPLYGALSRIVPDFHRRDGDLRFASINGVRGPKGHIQMYGGSRLRVRLPADRIATALPLVGKALTLGEHSIRLGVPQVLTLVPAATLQARLVTFKHALDAVAYLNAANQQLRELGIAATAEIPVIQRAVAIAGQPNRQGEPRRMVLRIKERRIVGYALRVSALTAEESIHLQEHGLGGRTRMGCGFFVPAR